jgi:hypothetical protein
MSAGGIFNGNVEGGDWNEVVPCVPLIVAMGSGEIASGSGRFTTYKFEDFIAQWIALFTKARHECVVASNPILKNITSIDSEEHEWRCFSPLLDMPKLSLATAGLEELKFRKSKLGFKKLPRPKEFTHGVYMPRKKNHKGLDAIAILPRGSNKRQTLIVVQTKFAVWGKASNETIDRLITNYHASIEQMEAASWRPGIDAAFLGVVGGEVAAADVRRFKKACPHGRLLYGKGLEAAMGPTVYPYFKHWRVLAAEVK